MNRRDFGKVLAAGFSLPFLGSANPDNEISYRVECRIKPKTFPDSEIAKKFACGRTKATAVIKGTTSHFIEVDVTYAFNFNNDIHD